MTRKARKLKIPKNAIEPLLETCMLLSKLGNDPANEIFKRFLGLMKTFEEYFFSEPWPKEYDHKQATDITDDDLEFLLGDLKHFWDRYTTVCLRKNMYLEGFMGYYGMMWTATAIDEIVFRPIYKKIYEEFENLRKNGTPSSDILVALKAEHPPQAIHDGIVDFLEHNYPDEETRKQIDGLLTMLHDEDHVPPCKHSVCPWYWRHEYEGKSKFHVDSS